MHLNLIVEMELLQAYMGRATVVKSVWGLFLD